jgi:hypothetical protein
MYDLKNSPLSATTSLAAATGTPEQEREYHRLRRKLARVQRTRLRPLASTMRVD